MAIEGEVTRAVYPTGELPLNEEVVTVNGNTCYGSFFINGNITSCLDSLVPLITDFKVFEGNVGAALRAVRRAGFYKCLVRVIAFETRNVPYLYLTFAE